jgi:RTX calcium-binding nonapeptide repeat (4 copies)/Dockerin type I domain
MTQSEVHLPYKSRMVQRIRSSIRVKRTRRLCYETLETRALLTVLLQPAVLDAVYQKPVFNSETLSYTRSGLAVFSSIEEDFDYFGAMAAGFVDDKEPEFGMNRALLEFPTKDLGAASKATLLVPKSDDNEVSTFAIYGYVGDGVITTSDYDRTATFIRTFSVVEGMGFTIDVTDFINSTAAQNPDYVGFRIQETEDSYWAIFGTTSNPTTLQVEPLNIVSVIPENGKLSQSAYGPYLRGVKLSENFTVTASAPTGFTTIKYAIDSGNSEIATKSTDSATWKFSTDVGLLSAGLHTVHVTMWNGTTQLDATEIKLNVLDNFQLDLDAKASQDSGEFLDIENIRLIDDIGIDLAFRGTLSGVSLLPVYANRLAVDAFKSGTKTEPDEKQVEFNNGVASFNLASATFADYKSDTSFDWDFFVVPAADYRHSLVTFNATPEQLFVTKLPKWMGTPAKREYRELTAKDPAFDQSGYAYALSLDISPVKYDFGTTDPGPRPPWWPEDWPWPGTPFGLFDGLETYVGMGATVVAYARLDGTSAAEVQALSFYAQAKVLGRVVLDKTIDLQDGSIRASGTLDGQTLEGEVINIETPLIDLLDEVKKVFSPVLIDGKTTLKEIPTPVPGVKANLEGSVHVELTRLAAQASLGINISGTSPVLDEATTFMRVIAAVDLETTIQGSIVLQVLGLTLASFTAGALLDVQFGADLRVNFSGGFQQPTPKFVPANNNAFLSVGLVTAWKIDLMNEDPSVMEELQNKKITDPESKERYTIPLFGLSLPSNFSSFKQGQQSGPITTVNGDPALGGISPAASRTSAADRGLAPTVDAMITLPGLASDNLYSFSYEAKIYADHQSLTDGQHVLDVILIDAVDGEQKVVDTWDLGLLSPTIADPFLGFTTGFLTKTVTIPTADLEFAHNYQLAVRFRSDRSGTGETVAVGVRNGNVQISPPKMSSSTSTGSLADNTLDFGTDSAGSQRGFVLVSNTGTVPLVVTKVTATAGFRGFALNLPATVLTGSVLAIPVDVIDPAAVVSGTLSIASNDPSAQTLALALKSNGGLKPLGPVSRIGTDLVITGTALNDTVVLHKGPLAGTIYVNMNGVDSVPIPAPARVVASLQEGNDGFSTDATIVTPLLLMGGPGNDTLMGAAGNDILAGEAGNDSYVFDTDLALGSDTIDEASSEVDTLDFGLTTHRAELPRIIDGKFTHIISVGVAGGTGRIEVQNNRFMQNPLNRFDVDRDGFIRPLDALQIINAVRRRGNGPFVLPTTEDKISRFYYDVSGTNDLTPLEALLVMNAIRRRVPGTGESRIVNTQGQDSLSVIENPPPLQQSISSLVETRLAVANETPLNQLYPFAPIASRLGINSAMGKSAVLAETSRPQSAVEIEAVDHLFAEIDHERGALNGFRIFQRVYF